MTLNLKRIEADFGGYAMQQEQTVVAVAIECQRRDETLDGIFPTEMKANRYIDR